MPVTKVVYRAKAERDLDEIYDFIADDNPVHAVDFVRRLRAFCRSLTEFPERGAARNDFDPGVRILVFEKRVTVAYKADGKRVQILRFFYAGRNTPAAFRAK
ncbi:type II toxin-antitoxin system RelE/ParE family toxin [Rhizobium sp. S152]|uniref:type II toxin-antitoxin system RelE/ParE family toxin n=1 Tax=Rhizobium sp. S152 TaxID=3055038 RepID=UPI0025A9DFB3|nr:type II toxin-antitoxin system RelE/ParE family toxin [Rhizobium sp. S152]MDM9626710.1 type II toxin-antitoxin system RelE/ParE family toxin [Rhizobium sp. S152]